MMTPGERRLFRQEKRDKKQAGNQRVRRLYKQALAQDPEANAAAEVDYGRLSTAELNGRDNDRKRRRDSPRDRPLTPPPVLPEA